ncbi:MAG TPA: DASS family sodium-coupled anion symporter [Bacteroidales bacterium]|nr:DASS family sodium-coupled anion symporter [Bacteroidales bacterium]HRZ20171.1 DASS family sodium-coupled anion symporter [Bacteroidales bacterium]
MDEFTKIRLLRLGKFLLSLFLAVGLTFLIKEPGFNDSQGYVLFLLFFAVGLWLTEAIPAFAVSLFIIAFLVFALGNKYFNSAPEDIAKYVNTFSSSVIWLMLGGFFLASAMTKTKLDQALFRFTLKISGTNPRNLLIGLMFTTMVASMMMSNTATTAMVIAAVTPLLASLGKKSGFTKALLLGIAIASTTGGMGTIIGTPPNAIAAGALENAGMSINFIDWMKYGLPLSIVLTSICCFVLIRLYLRDKTPISLDFLKEQTKDDSKEFLRQRRIVTGVIIVTVGLWLTTSLHGIKVAAVCAVPLVILTLTRVLDGKDIQRLPWDTLLLVAGGLSLGLALEDTGLLSHYGQKLIDFQISSIVMMLILAFITMLVSNIMSNTAASTVMIPLGMAILVGFKSEIALIIAFAASSSIFLPVSSPTNAIVFSTGYLEQKDFRTGGILLGVLGPVLAILCVLLIS